MFKYIIPIGDNCEIASQLTTNGFNKGSLFRYAKSELECIIDVLRNDFIGLFEKDNIIPINKNMVICKKYKIAWHTEFSIEKDDKGNFIFSNDGTYDNIYNIEINKIKYLSQYIKDALMDKSGRTLFIYKSNFGKFNYLLDFINLINDKYNIEFNLMVVKTEKQEVLLKTKELIIENVRHLAPYSDAMLGGDFKSWNEILKKYSITTNEYKDFAFKRFRLIDAYGNTVKLEPADILREIAFKLEDIGDIKTAFKIMGYAKKERPTGPVINEKYELYKKLLEPISKMLHEDHNTSEMDKSLII